MKLILTRHGLTEENIANIIQGHLPGKLSAKGKKQAKKVALRLKGEKIDFIYSSDLARSSDTAKEIAKFHPNTPIKFVKELRERYLAEFQGKKKSTFDKQSKNVETLKKMFNRAKTFLHKIISKHHKDTILFVGHNGINKALIAVITGKRYGDIAAIESQHNTSVSIFEIDEDKNHKIHLLNCIKHLD